MKQHKTQSNSSKQRKYNRQNFSRKKEAKETNGAALGAWSPIELGVFWGTLTGLVLAAVFCGFIAQLADMRRLLKEIRDQGKRPIQDPQQTPQELAAQDMEKTRSVLPRLP